MNKEEMFVWSETNHVIGPQTHSVLPLFSLSPSTSLPPLPPSSISSVNPWGGTSPPLPPLPPSQPSSSLRRTGSVSSVRLYHSTSSESSPGNHRRRNSPYLLIKVIYTYTCTGYTGTMYNVHVHHAQAVSYE